MSTTREDLTTWQWSWPDVGHDTEELCRIVRGGDRPADLPPMVLPADQYPGNPYIKAAPPICYPGTPVDLPPEMAELFLQIQLGQVNNIGCHTHGEQDVLGWKPMPGEGCFDDTQLRERMAISMIAGLLGGNLETVDGYLCSGGTEANRMGVLVGREWTRDRFPSPPQQGEIILGTGLSHYSLYQAVDHFDMGRSRMVKCEVCGRTHRMHHRMGNIGHTYVPDNYGPGFKQVGMNERGQMDMVDLERVFRLWFDRGFRRFIITPTVGTSLMGSIDPIREIAGFADAMNTGGAAVYVHVDAAFAGFTVPFVSDYKFAFEHPGVQSVTLDADKMGRLPYPAGVFLARKELMNLIALEVAYVRHGVDDTIAGSRSGAIAALAWMRWQQVGFDGMQTYVQQQLTWRDQYAALLRERFGTGDDALVKIHPYSAWVPFLPVSINLEDGKIPSEILEQEPWRSWCLRAEEFSPLDATTGLPKCPSETVYKLCVMPHVDPPTFDRFVRDLEGLLAQAAERAA